MPDSPIRREEIIGPCRLINADCLDILPALGKVDAVVTDPPYGIGANNKSTDKNNYANFVDDPLVVRRIVRRAMELAQYSRWIMTPGQKLMFAYEEPTAVGAFYYPAGTGLCSWGFVQWQPIFYYGKDPALQDRLGSLPNSFVSSEPAEKNGHPCPKPIGQWVRLVKRATRAGEMILDPFMGSGTTGVACVKLGRRFTGIEIDETYFDIACERIRKAVAQPDMFVQQPEPPKQEALFDAG